MVRTLSRSLVLVAALSTLAHAEPLPATRKPAPSESAASPKKPLIALALSLSGAALGWGILGLGESDAVYWSAAGAMVIGPSLGRYYAGDYFGPGIVLRGAGVAALFLNGEGCHDRSCSDLESNARQALIPLGLLAYLGGTFWDIARAPHDAEDWNRTHLIVSPVALQSGAHLAPGLGLSGRW
jgi:hypothetical protein